jgi:transposase
VSTQFKPVVPPNSDPLLAEIVAQLQEQLERKGQALALAEMKIRALEERLRLERIAKYGKRSEKLSDLQLELLDLEPGVSSEEVAAESEREPITPPASEKTEDEPAEKQRRKHPGRQTLPAYLERVERIIPCTPEQCTCGQCGREKPVFGYEVSEVLAVKPPEYYVEVNKLEKRACKNCEEQGVSTAPVPERIVPKSLLSDQVIVDIVVAKYCDSLPLYRQSAMLKRDLGLQIAVSTLDDAVMRVGEMLNPIISCMRDELLAGSYIQADETPVDVQMHDKRGKNHQAYLWQFGSPGKSAVFKFNMGREGKAAELFLGDFNGLLQTDGYAGYNHAGGPSMVHAFCNSHSRRLFVDAVKVDPKDADSVHIVQLYDKLFAIDRQAREEGMDHAERDKLRQAQAPPILEQLKAGILALQNKVLPKSTAGKAANYTLSRWSGLTLFLKYPELELSTNLSENSMRGIAIGRRNWIHIGSEKAGPKVAAIFSIVESCRRLGIPIRQYLLEVLPGLLNRSIKSVAQLTPAAFAAKRAK